MRVSDFGVPAAYTAQTHTLCPVHRTAKILRRGGVDLDRGCNTIEHMAVTHGSILGVRLLRFGLLGLLVNRDVLVERLVTVLDAATYDCLGIITPIRRLALLKRIWHLAAVEVGSLA